MRFEASSSATALFMNGKGAHVVNPWYIIVDLREETITIRKRNTHLIGVDEQVISFRYIRSINVNQHLFGADIQINVVGGSASAYYLTKSDANQIKQMLLNYNQTRKGDSIIFS